MIKTTNTIKGSQHFRCKKASNVFLKTQTSRTNIYNTYEKHSHVSIFYNTPIFYFDILCLFHIRSGGIPIPPWFWHSIVRHQRFRTSDSTRRRLLFATNSVTIIDTPATSLVGINNNGDLIGNMPIVISGTTLDQPAYKKNGTWYPMGYFAGATDQASAYQGQISENGNYITGQMSIDCCNSQAFLYNVSTSSLEEIF
ncbi:MAG: hypothetical protein IPG90_06695 [Bacteroidetes bacterium]|nr:hypothetical protein [Bacteroidota bacterium]